MIERTALSLLAIFLFSGCGGNDLEMTITYQEINGLKAEDPIFYKEKPIGRVSALDSAPGGDYRVEAVVHAEFRDSVTEYSVFEITEHPEKMGRKAIRMTMAHKGGEPLEEGALVKGASGSSNWLEQTEKGLEQGLDELREQYENFSQQLKKIPESEEFQNLRDELTRLGKELKQSGDEAREKIEKEVLPKLKEKLEELREKLEEFKAKEEKRGVEV